MTSSETVSSQQEWRTEPSTTPDAGRMFEEMLTSLDSELAIKTTEYTRRFVEIFNHQQVQDKLQAEIDTMNEKIVHIVEKVDGMITNSQSVFEIFKRMRSIVEDIKTLRNPRNIFELLSSSDFLGILNGEQFAFLRTESKSMEARVGDFIALMDELLENFLDDRSLDQRFEAFLKERRDNRKFGPIEIELRKLDKQLYDNQRQKSDNLDYFKKHSQILKREFKERLKEARIEFCMREKQLRKVANMKSEEGRGAYHEQVGQLRMMLQRQTEEIGITHRKQKNTLRGGYQKRADEIEKRTTQVTIARERLQRKFVSNEKEVRKHEKQLREEYESRIAEGLKSVTFDVTPLLSGENKSNANIRELQRILQQFFKQDTIDEELEQYLRLKDIENKCNECVKYFSEWCKKVRKSALTTYLQSSMKIEESLFMKEVERRGLFTFAVLFNNKSYAESHEKLLKEMIDEAGKISSPVVPWTAYGQLPRSNKCLQQQIPVQLVFDSSANESDLKSDEERLETIFNRFEITKREKNVMHANICSNVSNPSGIARSISKIGNSKIRAVLIGNFGRTRLRYNIDPRYNRIYSLHATAREPDFVPTCFLQKLPKFPGKEPYFCPDGWRKYAIDVGMKGNEFEKAYKNWPVAYHGTDGRLAVMILSHGFKSSGQGCFLHRGQGAVYLSPSIEYCGHPRYAKVRKIKDKYVQVVLQVRIQPSLIFKKDGGTLPGSRPGDPDVDPNFKNTELTWVVKWPPHSMMTSSNGILVYGMMFRVTDEHPGRLPQNVWWEKSQPKEWDLF